MSRHLKPEISAAYQHEPQHPLLLLRHLVSCHWDKLATLTGITNRIRVSSLGGGTAEPDLIATV